jgi:Chaperone of endosialidase
MRAYGGFLMITGASPGYIGAQLQPGSTAWSALSDRSSKERIVPVDGRAVLRKLGSIPIATWNWKSQDQKIRHMGPMAQDFSAAFGLGEDDKHISTVDADGVALAAIHGLHQMMQRKNREIAQLRRKLRAIEAKLGM